MRKSCTVEGSERIPNDKRCDLPGHQLSPSSHKSTGQHFPRRHSFLVISKPHSPRKKNATANVLFSFLFLSMRLSKGQHRIKKWCVFSSRFRSFRFVSFGAPHFPSPPHAACIRRLHTFPSGRAGSSSRTFVAGGSGVELNVPPTLPFHFVPGMLVRMSHHMCKKCPPVVKAAERRLGRARAQPKGPKVL